MLPLLFRRYLLATFLTLLTAIPAWAQSDGDQLRNLQPKLIALRQAQLEKNAELDVLRQEADLLGKYQVSSVLSVAKPELESVLEHLGFISGKFQTANTKILTELDGPAQKAKIARADALKSWNAAQESELSTLIQLRTIADQSRVAREASFWDPLTVGLIVALLAILLVTVLFVAHEQRLGIRRWRRGLRFTSVVLLVTFLPLAVLAGELDSLLTEWTTETDRLTNDQKKNDKDIQTITSEIKQLREKVRSSWRELTAIANKANPETMTNAVQEEQKIYDTLHAWLVDTAVATKAIAEAKLSLDRTTEYRDTIGSTTFYSEGHHLWWFGVRLGFAVVTVLGTLWWLRKVRGRSMIRLEESAKECPCCGASGKLEERGSSVPDPRYPDPKQIYCPDCNYRFRPDYRDYRRLCFPYVGVPTSGKTHSVLMVYDRVSSGRAARDLKLQRMELQSLMSSEEEKKFDKQVKVLFEEHKGPKGTPHLLPRPLTLLVRDADRTGRNSTLINLFDFAGEIMDKSVDTDVLRRRALQGDGFLLYLDPTQVSSTSGSNNLSVADQIRDLQRFYRDMCDAHKIKDGRIDIPVAVCVSKIDLLISDNPIGDGARDFIRVMQKTEGQPLTLEVLEERSRACKRILPVILPGFNLREMLGEMFGVRYLFFPLSPVSIVEGELGIKALRGRTILPFGIVEPIMWLLHMHGYQVFPKRTGKS